MTASTSAGSAPDSSNSRSAAATDRSLTCSPSAAIRFSRSPNFSTSTASGMPHAAASSAAVKRRSGRYEAVAASPTCLTGAPAPARPAPPLFAACRSSLRRSRLEDAADDPLQLRDDARRQLVPVAPEDPAHPDELAEAHERPGRHLRIEGVADLARARCVRERLDVALREPLVVVMQHR